MPEDFGFILSLAVIGGIALFFVAVAVGVVSDN